MTEQNLNAIVIPLKRKTDTLKGYQQYYDFPATRESWTINLDILFHESQEIYVKGTIASDDSTALLRRELQQISRYF